jgi:phenylalanyl-tRNA synthetase alpha chain
VLALGKMGGNLQALSCPVFQDRAFFIVRRTKCGTAAVYERMIDDMKEKLEAIRAQATAELSETKAAKALDALRVKYLGKKGELTAILKQMGQLTAEERPKMGQLANAIRADIEAAISEKQTELSKLALQERLSSETIDITLPGKKQELGSLHPLSIVENEIREIFLGMGFEIADGPEVEYDYYNFEALNLPPDHPARDTQDTFYITDQILLRTQTSSVQVHVMENKKPPIRVISPGRVFRSDAVDATHSPLFHQIEGLVVDKGITMADLKGTLELLMKRLYGDDCTIRLRPHHFPFTEPSAEVDVMCFNCHGKGCRICKNEGFIELLGAGMVHPKVLEGCGIDSSVYSGFAFGLGLERIVMRRYNISDMRLLFENDYRFLEQF